MPQTATNSILTSKIIQDSIQAVNDYSKTASELYSELESIINTLTSANFTGAASNGYKTFFTTKATPALTENLDSLTSGINSMLDAIKTQLLDTVDEQLGEANSNPGAKA